MKITIEAEPKEIADLVLTIQNRPLLKPGDSSDKSMSLNEYREIHSNDQKMELSI